MPLALSTRILHILNGVAADNRFGGVPIVAMQIADAQRARGHRTLIAAGAPRDEIGTTRLGGSAVLLAANRFVLRKLGFGALFSPGLYPRLIRAILSSDIVHIHLGRDLNTLVAATVCRALRKPYILQTHGMMDAPNNSVGKLVDVLASRSAVRGAGAVFALTADEVSELESLARGRVQITILGNGVPAQPPTIAHSARPRTTVLFVGRLHPRKNASAFARAALAVIDDLPSVDFRVVGPDEGDLQSVARIWAQLRPDLAPRANITGALSHPDTLALMASSMVLVVPAVDEPFGLTTAEALSVGTPVIVHSSSWFASSVLSRGAGLVFTSEADLCAAIVEIASNTNIRTSMSSAAIELAKSEYSMQSLLTRIHEAYSVALTSQAVRPR